MDENTNIDLSARSDEELEQMMEVGREYIAQYAGICVVYAKAIAELQHLDVDAAEIGMSTLPLKNAADELNAAAALMMEYEDEKLRRQDGSHASTEQAQQPERDPETGAHRI